RRFLVARLARPRSSTLFPYTTLFRSSCGLLLQSGTVRAAVHLPVAAHAVPDHRAAAVRAARGEGVDGALERVEHAAAAVGLHGEDRKSTRLNSSHVKISYAVFCLKKK